MPLSYVNVLYQIAEERIKSKEGQDEHAAEVLEDELEDALT